MYSICITLATSIFITLVGGYVARRPRSSAPRFRHRPANAFDQGSGVGVWTLQIVSKWYFSLADIIIDLDCFFADITGPISMIECLFVSLVALNNRLICSQTSSFRRNLLFPYNCLQCVSSLCQCVSVWYFRSFSYIREIKNSKQITSMELNIVIGWHNSCWSNTSSTDLFSRKICLIYLSNQL